MKKFIAIVVAIAVIAAVAVTAIHFTKNSNKLDETKVIATFQDFDMADHIFDDIHRNPARYRDFLPRDCAMPKEEVEELIETPENWLLFTLFIDVANASDDTVAVTHLEIPENGKDGLYINTNIEGDIFTVSPGDNANICVSVFLNNNDPSLEEVEKMVKALDISIPYTALEKDFKEIPTEFEFSAKVTE